MSENELEMALKWAKANKPEASVQHRVAFANSVARLVRGSRNGGIWGGSLRDYLCAEMASVEKPPGTWRFEEAVRFCEPLCFTEISQLNKAAFDAALSIKANNYTLDDDPRDISFFRDPS